MKQLLKKILIVNLLIVAFFSFIPNSIGHDSADEVWPKVNSVNEEF